MSKLHKYLSLGAVTLAIVATAACEAPPTEGNVDQPDKQLAQQFPTALDAAQCARVEQDPAVPSQVKVTNIRKDPWSNLFTYVEVRLTSKDRKARASISFPVAEGVPSGGSIVSPQKVENWAYCSADVVVSSHYPDGY